MTSSALWTPSPEFRARAALTRYMRWLARQRGLKFADYDALWRWSVQNIDGFWASIWEYYDVRAKSPYQAVLGSRAMPGANWFPGATLNFAEHVLRQPDSDEPALIFQSETRGLDAQITVSWTQLKRQVNQVAAALRAMGVGQGDRVAAYLPNIPEAVIAFLACASIGAIWSSCSPDMGATAVLDRFKQIEPKVLFAIDGYLYNGKTIDRRDTVTQLVTELPSVAATVHVSYLGLARRRTHSALSYGWVDLIENDAPVQSPVAVPFSHPLWVLYSSGTTGLPKPIVQSHGGILLEHLKTINLQCDLQAGDRLFWFTTTGWMMWNFVVGGLLCGVTAVLYDGSPGLDGMRVLWRLAASARVTLFGVSAAYISACMQAGVSPSQFDLSALRAVGSTGSPLTEEGFDWIYDRVKRDVWLVSLSGGTDVCTAFVGGCALRPVYRGEIQCRALGADVQAFDDAGVALQDAVGELVVCQPMPSMPVLLLERSEHAALSRELF